MTKNKSSAGRFGARYGMKLRNKVNEIEKRQKALHPCPYCKVKKVKRVTAGIWQCGKCDAKFTGKAYSPTDKRR